MAYSVELVGESLSALRSGYGTRSTSSQLGARVHYCYPRAGSLHQLREHAHHMSIIMASRVEREIIAFTLCRVVMEADVDVGIQDSVRRGEL